MENKATEPIEQVESLQQENQLLKEEIADLRLQVKLLLEQLRLSRHQRFGPTSERSDTEQLRLFNEA
jgi:hypothetical protein